MTSRALDTRASEGWLFGTGLRVDQGKTWPLRLEHWAGSGDRGSGRRAPLQGRGAGLVLGSTRHTSPWTRQKTGPQEEDKKTHGSQWL